jgi:hypothetical protein
MHNIHQTQLQLDLEESNSTTSLSSEFSDYIVYVDESGTSNFSTSDTNYPVFVLAFCIFHKNYYAREFVPTVQSLKFQYFGHDMVIFHEKEIRKKEPPFTFTSKEKEENFITELHQVLEDSKFILIASVIQKQKVSSQDTTTSAYNVALDLCLEKLYEFLSEKDALKKRTFIIFEARGTKEDRELELEFRRICDAGNKYKLHLPFEITISSKKVNSVGLQIADLVARPVGRHIIDGKGKTNRAFNMLERKFYCKDKKALGENYINYGLNIYPK